MLAVLALLPLVLTDRVETVAVRTLIFAIMAVGWNLMSGYGGMFSFGHAAFFGVGAYTDAYLLTEHNVSPWISMVVGALIAAAVGSLIAYLCLRYKLAGAYFALATFAFAQMFLLLVQNLEVFNKTEGFNIEILPSDSWAKLQFQQGSPNYFWIPLALLGLGVLMTILFAHSRSGQFVQAARDDQTAAASLGINAMRHRLLTVALSCGTHCRGRCLLHAVLPVRRPGAGVRLRRLDRGDRARGHRRHRHDLGPGHRCRDHRAALRRGGQHAAQPAAVPRLPAGHGRPRRGAVRRHPDRDRALPAQGRLRFDPGPVVAPMSLLQVESLSKAYAGLHAVENVSVQVEEREFLGIIGPNGAGKTTLFSLLAGEQPPTSGRVVFDGQDITGWPAYKVADAGLVRTFQLMRPFGSMTVLENVTIAAMQRHRSRAAARRHALEVLDRVQLGDKYAVDSGSLSTAGLKRLELARALALEPRVVLLDEVLAGLVPAERAPMIDLLRQLHGDGLTVVFVEHIMAAVMALSQRLVVMHEGQVLVEGPPREVVEDPRVVEAYLGEEPA